MSGSGRVVIGLLKAEKSFQLLIKDEGDKIKIRRLWIALLHFFQFFLPPPDIQSFFIHQHSPFLPSQVSPLNFPNARVSNFCPVTFYLGGDKSLLALPSQLLGGYFRKRAAPVFWWGNETKGLKGLLEQEGPGGDERGGEGTGGETRGC